MKYEFDNDFRFKDLPDETTPHTAENMNKALENTSWLKSQLDGTIEPMSGSSIEINDSAEAMLNKLEIEGKSYQETRNSKNLIDLNKHTNSLDEATTIIDNNSYKFDLDSLTKNWSGRINLTFENLEENTDYILSFEYENANPYLIVRGDSSTIIERYYNRSPEGTTFNTSTYSKIEIYIYAFGASISSYSGIANLSNIQLEKGTVKTDFELYGASPSPEFPSEIKSVGKLNDQGKYEIELTISKDNESKTTTFVLNEPLRSLPNGTKDLLYIKNGHLFVERNVYSIICDANMNFEKGNVGMHGYCFYIYLDKPTNYDGNQITSTLFSNRFKTIVNSTALMDIGCISKSLQVNRLYFFINTNITSVEQVKNWFTNNRTEIIYDLAEPTIEDLGEIEMPSTFKDKTTITTTDELEPNINLEYVKDTILTNYVEKRLINLIK